MRYPNFAAALRSYGKTVAEIQARLKFKSYSQTIQYLQGRTLPRAEKILLFPDLVEAARQDVMQRQQPEQLAA